ncbi:FGGY-family carbohydrate kinase [uncultured Sphaerochaeta sp.]|uniref:xylulokinase n=1 Tax=uncultured Sphaerochaeta sp. TaxID=886478 RepID=UPI002A0A8F9B|nr:FGGY-family carbohydrate kinase [uncultured Sphaerochaeta sp.]
MEQNKVSNEILEGNTILGIEFGSTRIKAVLINSQNEPIAQGGFDWENSLVNGIWTYSLDEINTGLATSFKNLTQDVQNQYGVSLTKTKALGISAMMHGYLAFDKHDELLVPFRTWRNTITRDASEQLSELFDYPVPERWSISHLYQAILNKEEHVKNLAYVCTLASYVHWKLTGEKVLGIGDASGMFPIDVQSHTYDKKMVKKFDTLIKDYNYSWDLSSLLPKALLAGEAAGKLTKQGALLLDPTGTFEAGIPLCPPEGDAGTGMVATNSIAQRTGNVSAGTSVFAMIVLEKELSKSYNKFIDLVTTPDGSLVAMAHANNCTGEYDQWIRLFKQVVEATGNSIPKGKLYDILLGKALEGDKDCGGLLPFNYISGETMTGIYEGRPLFVRLTNNHFTLENFMRAQLFTALGALRTGMDILFEKEHVQVDAINGHGGFFKTAEVGQKMMAAAMHTPISVLKTAGEGGAWGIALLASYLVNAKDARLQDFLANEVFASSEAATVVPSLEDIEGFNVFFANYKKGLAVEKAAVENLD